MVLLGAGASKPAEIPTAFEMTRKMLDAVEQQGVPHRIRKAVRIAVASLQFGTGLRDERPTGDVNVEEVVNVLTTLERRHELEAVPLIGAWHPIVEDLDQIFLQPNSPRFANRENADGALNSILRSNRERHVDQIVTALEAATRGGSFPKSDLREAITGLFADANPPLQVRARPQTVATQQGREVPGMGKVYANARRFLVNQLKVLVWRSDTNLDYLKPLVERAFDERFPIITLNYDNTIERTARALGAKLDSGINYLRENGMMGYGDPNAIPYRKLHGSIHWTLQNENPDSRAPLPREVIAEASDKEMQDAEYEPALIFGGRNKLTARGPFLDLLLDFRDRLRATNELIVIGYSFGDDHINEYIAQWMNTGPQSKLTIINGPNFAAKATGFAKRLIAVGSPRVTDTRSYAETGIATIFDTGGKTP